MAAYEWSKATAADIRFIADHARESDVAELLAVAGATPEEAMRLGLEESVAAWTGKLHGIPCCMFGVGPYQWADDHGVCWMVGTDLIDLYPKTFLRGSIKAFAEMHKLFPILCNHVDARHEKAINWLQWAGAEIAEPAPYGVAGLPFRYFQIRRVPCAGLK